MNEPVKVWHRLGRWPNGRLYVRMGTCGPWPWFQAHRTISSRKDVPAAIAEFVARVEKGEGC